MFWALLIGICGGACAVLALRWHEARAKEFVPSEADEFEIVDDMEV